jgi:tetratricopeptide (TPR) repeat protein
VRLFVDRARAVRPDFALDGEHARAVAEICARLDGLPLAIELAAARVRVLSPRQIADRLDEALPVLSGGGRDRPARQQTLRDAIAWSHDMLDEPERTFFRRLAVFRGGCTFEAAEAVGDPQGADVLDLLGSLVDKSLLLRLELDEGSRFQFLFVIREYAKERLAAGDDETATRDRHAAYVARFLRDAAPRLFGAEQPEVLDRIEREHDNVRAAIEWSQRSGDAATALALVGPVWRFWQMRGHLREGRERLDDVLAMPGVEEHPLLLADALDAAGGVAYWMAEWEAAGTRYGAALELRRTLGDRSAIAESAYNLACVYAYGAEPTRSIERADELLGEALTIFREGDDRLGIAKVLWATGGNLIDGRPADAVRPFEESLVLYRELGDRFGEAWALHMLGLAEALIDRVDEAEAHMLASLELFLRADDRSAVSILLNDFAVVATQREQVERALRLHGAALEFEARSGVGLGTSATNIGGVLERLLDVLPDDETRALIDEGRAMPIDEALAYAMKRED